jgi:hypothetical protein
MLTINGSWPLSSLWERSPDPASTPRSALPSPLVAISRGDGFPAMNCGYLGNSDSFAQAIALFAESYAAQTERDHTALLAAIKEGRVLVCSSPQHTLWTTYIYEERPGQSGLSLFLSILLLRTLPK